MKNNKKANNEEAKTEIVSMSKDEKSSNKKMKQWENTCTKTVHQRNKLSRDMCFIRDASELEYTDMLMMYYLASQINSGDDEFKAITMKPGELSQILGISLQGGHNKKIYDKKIKEMTKKSFQIQVDDEYRNIVIFEYSAYNVKTKLYSFKLHPQLKPFFLGMKNDTPRTIFKFGYIKQLKKLYSMRLYILACSIQYGYPDGLYYTINDFKDRIGYNGDDNRLSYDVLTSAINEINKKTDITVWSQAVKHGKKIIGIKIRVTPKSITLKDEMNIAPIPQIESNTELMIIENQESKTTETKKALKSSVQYKDLPPEIQKRYAAIVRRMDQIRDKEQTEVGNKQKNL